MKHKTLLLDSCSLKFASDEGVKFSGYASVFGGLDSYRDSILPGAYKQVIDKIKRGESRMPKMFVNHRSWDLPIGKWTMIEEDENGLKMEGELTPGNPQASTVRAAMQHETIDGLSIGYSLKEGDSEMIQDGDGGKIRLIKNISDLPEISIVTFPADDSARVDLLSVKNALDQVTTIREFEDFLRDAAGFSKSLATATAARAKRIFVQGEPDNNGLPDDLRQRIAMNLNAAKTLFERN